MIVVVIEVVVLGFAATMLAGRCGGRGAENVVAGAQPAQTALLTMTMFALGARMNIATFRKVGSRPFLLAFDFHGVGAGIALTGAAARLRHSIQLPDPKGVARQEKSCAGPYRGKA